MPTRVPHPARIVLVTAMAAFCVSVQAAGYQAIDIVAPAQEATVHDNEGRVPVRVSVSPPLRAAAGDRLVLVLDGGPLPPSRNGHLHLTDLDRGSHVLQAEVIDASGRALIRSDAHTFHVWKASALFPNRSRH